MSKYVLLGCFNGLYFTLFVSAAATKHPTFVSSYGLIINILHLQILYSTLAA
jgi:hypothetical protein